MSDTLPLPESVVGRAKEGFDRLLLAPVFLIYEIVAVILPGVLLITLLLLKGNHTVVAALQSPLLGYKTKLFVALIFSYLAGKVFVIPSEMIIRVAIFHFSKKLDKPELKADVAKKFFTGAFILPAMFGTEHALDYFVLGLMTASFYFSTGAVLLVSSLFPGDHALRLVEGAGGVLFCIRGYKGFYDCIGLGVTMFGVALSGTIQKLASANVAVAWQIGLKLMFPNTPQTPPTQTPPTQASPS
jgi:hypothetical protein